MLNKKEIIEKLREFIKSQNKLLLFDINGTGDIISLILKILVNDIKDPLNIGFISTSDEHFGEVFSRSSSTIKTNTDYHIGGHKINFYLYSKDLMKDSFSDKNYIIIYPCDDIKEKELIKFFSSHDNLNKVIFINKNSTNSYKHIKKLLPFVLSLKETANEKYWNMIKSTYINK